jgi:hypothetical protein
MLSSVFEGLFGCSHRRTTFPITPKRPTSWAGAYVTCLDCGKEFAYNWNEMRREETKAEVPLSSGAIPQPSERPIPERPIAPLAAR